MEDDSMNMSATRRIRARQRVRRTSTPSCRSSFLVPLLLLSGVIPPPLTHRHEVQQPLVLVSASTLFAIPNQNYNHVLKDERLEYSKNRSRHHFVSPPFFRLAGGLFQQQQQQQQQKQRQQPQFDDLLPLSNTNTTASHSELAIINPKERHFHCLVQNMSRRGHETLTHSIPALLVYTRRQRHQSMEKQRHRRYGRGRNLLPSWMEPSFTAMEVAVQEEKLRSEAEHDTMTTAKSKEKKNFLPLSSLPSSLPNLIEIVTTTHYFDNAGTYYGVDLHTIDTYSKEESSSRPEPLQRQEQQQRRQPPPKLQDSMQEALEELRMMRQEMEQMRQEFHTLKLKMIGEDDEQQILEESSSALLESEDKNKGRNRAKLRQKQKEAEKLAADIESWAQQLLQEGEEEGWKPVECNKMVRGSLNEGDRTTAYIKWMKDSRGPHHANADDKQEYPCIKCYSTIDAPLEDVCTYLSQEVVSAEYNDLIQNHKDVEILSTSAKICWSQSPQILFIKPRDFVTFCHHKWKKDGTEVIVNQACDHSDFPLEQMEKEGKSCRGYALRGANFLSRCPGDPSKTRITMIAHANPGGGLPQWASKTAVNALAPIEPFKLFHRINHHVQQHQPELRETLAQATEMVSNMPPGHSPRPGGIAQLGYACFWPKGGGTVEGGGGGIVGGETTIQQHPPLPGPNQSLNESNTETQNNVDSNERSSDKNVASNDISSTISSEESHMEDDSAKPVVEENGRTLLMTIDPHSS